MLKRRSLIARAAGLMSLAGLGRSAVAQQAAVPKPYTAEDFARRPLLERAALSPDGQRFAAIVNKGKYSTLVTRAAAGGPMSTVQATDNLEFQFNWFRWVNNERLLLSVRYPAERRVGNFSTADVTETRLLSVRADGKGLINLVRNREDGLDHAQFQDNVIDWNVDPEGKYILLGLPDGQYHNLPGVFRVNVETGGRIQVHASRTGVRDWLTDAQHRVRVGIEYEEGQLGLVVCDPDGSNWRRVRRFGLLSAEEIAPLGFGLDPNLLYVQAQHAGLRAIHTIDLRDPELKPQLKYANPDVDLHGELLHSAKTGEAVGIVTGEAGNAAAYFWEPSMQALAANIDRALPERSNRMLQFVADDKVYLMRSEGNGIPGELLVGNREKGSLAVLSEFSPQLDPDRLARKKPVTVKARDGLVLHGFLTLPPGTPRTADKPAAPLPLVMLPHGGPQSHDTMAFDTWPAFIADRGYAVLQLNFRGSTGYGQALMEAGLKRWGLEMQEDLEDGVAALVERGIADPKRVAIVGASYGGYAALMGAVKTPKLYRGAFAFAPVTDLVEFVREADKFWWESAGFGMARQVGKLPADRERLVATSPRLQVGKIEVPVVLIHGTRDRQVPHDHSVWMAEALAKAGKPHVFISQERGDHQLSHQPYRSQFFEQLDSFLAKTLGPGSRS